MPRRRFPRESRPSSADGEYSGTPRNPRRGRLHAPASAVRSSRRAPFRARPGERCTAAGTFCRNHNRSHSIVSWQSTSRASICPRRKGRACRVGKKGRTTSSGRACSRIWEAPVQKTARAPRRISGKRGQRGDRDGFAKRNPPRSSPDSAAGFAFATQNSGSGAVSGILREPQVVLQRQGSAGVRTPPSPSARGARCASSPRHRPDRPARCSRWRPCRRACSR